MSQPTYAEAGADPLYRVLELGDRQLPFGVGVGALGALFVHLLGLTLIATSMAELAAFAERVRNVTVERQRIQYDIDAPDPVKPEEPPPPPEPAPEEPAAKAPETKATAAEKAGEPPPPAAAEAGKVLTEEPNPDEPVDLTGDRFVSGDSDRFAGGTTAAGGTSKTAVTSPNAKAGGKPGGTGKTPGATGTAPTATAKDSSKPASPTSRSWNCGFPPEADFDQIDYATVMISVTVGTDGRAKSVNVLNDPGHGFGRLAKSCAMRMQYNVGLDKDGQAIVKTTSPFPVRFTR